MKTKHLVEQRNKFGQRLTLDVELKNGEPLNLNRYAKHLLQTQDLQAWQGAAEDLREWFAGEVQKFIMGADFNIYGHSN